MNRILILHEFCFSYVFYFSWLWYYIETPNSFRLRHYNSKSNKSVWSAMYNKQQHVCSWPLWQVLATRKFCLNGRENSKCNTIDECHKFSEIPHMYLSRTNLYKWFLHEVQCQQVFSLLAFLSKHCVNKQLTASSNNMCYFVPSCIYFILVIWKSGVPKMATIIFSSTDKRFTHVP